MRISNRATTVLACTAWLLAWTLIDPRGEFPLNDDWAYSIPVRTLLEEGRFQLLDWGAMTLFFQVLWGALFCAPFGFSFLTLRLATAVLALLAVASFYGILREARLSRRATLVATAALAFNPVYFNLSHTFMTDVPFVSVALCSVYVWLRWIRSFRATDLVAVLVLVVVATLIRQVGIALGFGFAVASLLVPRENGRSWSLAAIHALLPPLALLTYNLVADATFGLPAYSVLATAQFLDVLERGPIDTFKIFAPRIASRSLGSFIYLGLFCLPVSIGSLFHLRSRAGPEMTTLRTALAIAAVVLAVALFTDRVFPHFGDALPFGSIVNERGLGPATLVHPLAGGETNLPSAPWTVWAALTIAGALGGALLLQRCLVEARRLVRLLRPGGAGNEQPSARDLLVIWTVVTGGLYITPFLLTWVFFDRYLLFLLPFGLLICTHPGDGPMERPPAFSAALSGALTAIMAAASIAGTHDYLSWNRARWDLAHDLVYTRGLPVESLDGGFEFNMSYRYDMPGDPRGLRGSGEYILSFPRVPGYAVQEIVTYRRWLPPGEGQIHLLHRTADSETKELE